MKSDGPILIIGYYGIGKSTVQELRPELDIFDLHNVEEMGYLVKNIEHKYVVADPKWVEVFSEYAKEHNRWFYVVVPSLDRKTEFLENYQTRKHGMTSKNFVKRRSEAWEKEITALRDIPNASVIELRSGFLADIIERL